MSSTAASATPGSTFRTHSKWMMSRTRSIDESCSTRACAVEAGVHVAATAERLDRADAGRAFLHLRREVARVVLHLRATPPNSAAGGSGG